MNGTEFFEFVQDKLNENVEIVSDDCVSYSMITDLDKRCGNVSVTLTEYRRLYTLFKSLGVNVDSEDFISLFVCDDFEMLTEWMKFHRNNGCDLDSFMLEYIHKYSEEFGMNMLEMFKYVMNDEKGGYLEGIMECIAGNWYDSVNDTDETIWGEDSTGREFTFRIMDIWDHIDGFLIDFVSLSWFKDSDYVFMVKPRTMLNEEGGKEILRKFWGTCI